LGDSYTIGQGVDAALRFPAQLADSLSARGIRLEPVQIIARTGWTTGNLLNAIAAQDPTEDQDLVTLLIGVNNEYQYRPLAEYEAEFQTCLEAAVRLAKGNRDRVCVISIPDYGYTPYGQSNQTVISGRIDAFNSINRQITTQQGIAYVDITPVSRQMREDFVASDGLHPSAIQYAAWVHEMVPVIETMLK
jgi:lysophospholipase L1-like esterase